MNKYKTMMMMSDDFM